MCIWIYNVSEIRTKILDFCKKSFVMNYTRIIDLYDILMYIEYFMIAKKKKRFNLKINSKL